MRGWVLRINLQVSGISWSGSISHSWLVSILDWASISSNSWGSISLDDWSNSLDDGWGRSINDGVESVDGVSGVGHSSDSTIGLNKGVLTLNDISVTGFAGRLGVSGETILNGVSVAVLWVGIVWFWGNGLDDCWGCVGKRSMDLGHSWSVSQRRSSVGWLTEISDWAAWAGSGHTEESENDGSLDHFDMIVLRREKE